METPERNKVPTLNNYLMYLGRHSVHSLNLQSEKGSFLIYLEKVHKLMGGKGQRERESMREREREIM